MCALEREWQLPEREIQEREEGISRKSRVRHVFVISISNLLLEMSSHALIDTFRRVVAIDSRDNGVEGFILRRMKVHCKNDLF